MCRDIDPLHAFQRWNLGGAMRLLATAVGLVSVRLAPTFMAGISKVVALLGLNVRKFREQDMSMPRGSSISSDHATLPVYCSLVWGRGFLPLQLCP